MPHDGKIVSMDMEITYKEGVEMEKKMKMGEQSYLEKKFNFQKNQWITKIFRGNILELEIFSEKTKNLYESFYLSAEIIRYENGKAKEKAILKNGLLEKGNLSLPYGLDGKEEYEKKDKWLIKKTYQGQTLVKEEKINTEKQEYPQDYFHEDKIIEAWRN